MNLLSEIFIEILFRRMLVRFFGYYTLLFIYKLFNNKKGVEWLSTISKNEGEEFGKDLFVALVGLASFILVFILIGFIYDSLTS